MPKITKFAEVPIGTGQKIRPANSTERALYYKSPRGSKPGAYDIRKVSDNSIARVFLANDLVEWVD